MDLSPSLSFMPLILLSMPHLDLTASVLRKKPSCPAGNGVLKQVFPMNLIRSHSGMWSRPVGFALLIYTLSLNVTHNSESKAAFIFRSIPNNVFQIHDMSNILIGFLFRESDHASNPSRWKE